MDKRKEWLEKAEKLKPTLYRQTIHPVSGIPESPLAEGNSVVLDFGTHWVGHLTLKLGSVGSHPDAPAWLRFKFCENERELNESAENYRGWISKGWIQQEEVHVDVLPAVLSLPRRYAFRYVRIDVLALSSKYQLTIQEVFAETTTSMDASAVPAFAGTTEDIALDRAALRTLRSCMQDFFEDGPKRDRRLWIGDLRLQALAHSAISGKSDLVKRCLYLFAGTTRDDGRIAACLFTEPEVEADDTFMFDYSLFFIPTLLNYVEHTGDVETGRDLIDLALTQLTLADRQFDSSTQVINDSDVLGWCFIDWNLNLNKQASAQAVWIYCAKAAVRLLSLLDMQSHSAAIEEQIALRSEAALKYFYESERHLFVSGAGQQVSWASQVWFVLAGVLEANEAALCLQAADSCADIERMVTPYMMHHYIEALVSVGQLDKAREKMRGYWGGMIAQGADTFWELFNPADPDESPYGSPIVNSYCHAWSCTPLWFLRSRFVGRE